MKRGAILLGLCLTFQGPPAGHPFAEAERRGAMLARYMTDAREILGLSEIVALQLAADALGVVIREPGQPARLWRPTDGTAPILRAIP